MGVSLCSFFLIMFIHVLPLEIQLSRGELSGLTLSHFFMHVPSQDLNFKRQ